MIPAFIRRIGIVSVVLGLVAFLFWLQRDVPSGLAFGAAAAWAVANLFVWTAVVVTAIRPGPRNVAAVLVWVTLKIMLLAGGFAALVVASPMSRASLVGVIAGISIVFVVALLAAVSALIMGVDLLTGKRTRSASDKDGSAGD